MITNFKIGYGSNSGSFAGGVTPFLIELLQGGNVIHRIWSTEGDYNTSIFIKTVQFDTTVATTIKYYNLGGLSNSINLRLLTGITYEDVPNNSGLASNQAYDGRVVTQTLDLSTNLSDYYLSVNCQQSNNTPSGVTYSVVGSNIVSAKTGDSGFVSSSTPNISLNPNYNSGGVTLTAPIVSNTTRLNTDNLVISGMQSGDILRTYLNSTLVNTETLNSSTKALEYLSGLIGTLKFNYIRTGVVSPDSVNVTVTENNTVLAPPSIVSNTPDKPNLYIGEKVNVTNIQSGATLNILKAGVTAVLDTDYSIVSITGGFQITFLVSGNFGFYTSKSSYTNSDTLILTVGTTRPVLTVPILNDYSILINETVTITNGSSIGYDAIDVYKNDVIVLPNNGDFTVVGYVYTLLTAGTYNFVGKKAGFANSNQSTDVEVGVVVAPVVTSTLYQNGGGTYDIVIGQTTTLSYTGTKPSGGSILWFEKNLDTGNLSSRGSTETLDVTPNIGNYGYVAKFQNSSGGRSAESNLIKFNFVTQVQTNKPVAVPINNTVKAILGFSGTSKDVEIWGKISPSTSFVKIGSTVTTLLTEYIFTSLADGIYKVKATQSGLTTSEFSEEVVVSTISTCTLSNLSVTPDVEIPYLYNVLFLNPQSVNIKYTLFDSDNNILQTELSFPISVTEVTNQYKGVIDFSNIIEGTNYILLISSVTEGKNCSLLSSPFNFDVIADEPNVITLQGEETKDCKSFNISNIVETVVSTGLKLVFKPVFTGSITNNPPYNVLITKGAEVIYTSPLNIQELDNSGNLECIIPTDKIPVKNSSITILVTVTNTEGEDISDVYGCTAQVNYIISSDISVLDKSLPPILLSTDANNSELSASCCVGGLVDFYINNLLYKSVISTTNIATVSVDEGLLVGDVITAKQTCPNKLKSDFSGSITITSTCTKVSEGFITGEETVIQNSIKTYSVEGILGNSPFEYVTTIVGGTIEAGLNTSKVTVKITDPNNAIISIKVFNCNNKFNITLLKTVYVNQVVGGVLIAPQLVGILNKSIQGIGTPNSFITIYNSNNEVIATNIIVDSRGVFIANKLKNSNAYYAIATSGTTKSGISNILVNISNKCSCNKYN